MRDTELSLATTSSTYLSVSRPLMLALPRKDFRAGMVLLVRTRSHSVSLRERPVAARIEGRFAGQLTGAGA